MDKLLLLNGAEERLQVVLTRGKEPVFVQELRAPGQGVSLLPQAVDNALRLSGIQVNDLSGIACVRGPGSFTGLRIVLSLAHGLGFSGNVPLAGLDYLILLAHGVALCSSCTVLWVCTYARRSMVYVQGFALEHGVRPLSVLPQFMDLEACWSLLSAKGQAGFGVVGSGVRRNLSWWQKRLSEEQILPCFLDNPLVPVLVEQALTAEYDLKQIFPVYLRSSDAEDNLSMIAAKKGLTEEEARSIFAASTLEIREHKSYFPEGKSG